MACCNSFNVFFRTIGRDMTMVSRFIQCQRWINEVQAKDLTVPMIFARIVEKHPNKTCFIFEDKTWTFKQIDELSNQVAHVFENAGFKPDDTVALMMNNRPEYVAIWLGLAKAGIVTALINHNLKSDPLRHCIEIAHSKAVVFGVEFSESLADIKSNMESSMRFYAFDVGDHPPPAWCDNLDTALAQASTDPLEGKQRQNCNDKALYIYTSGTTGLPKAAIIRHVRFAFMAAGVHFGTQIQTEDVVYDTLPLYHSAGGTSCLGQSIVFGCTLVLRKKFSASGFWVEACRHQCTVAMYIGEICRYLLAVPERPEEKTHKIRMMFGNGMRPQIWENFSKRFNVPLICELYAATEGNANVLNFEGVVGAVGFIPLNFPSLYPVTLIKADAEGQPVRAKNGLCVRCKPHEPGMFVGMIDKNNPIRKFDGYADKKATEKKVIRDVLRRGDAAFLSGDILEMDDLGYLYFKDRTGDTFRWRGENVSTTEVEAVVSNVAGLKDCAVYGVEVPGSEGRAGMAAILDPDRTLDLVALAQGLAKVLPTYARPLFIRIVSSMDMTGTYKLRKVDYQKEGFDPSAIADDLFLMDAITQSYVPLTNDLYEQLLSGKMRI